MISIYSHGYSSKDLQNIADILRAGRRLVCPNIGITAFKDVRCYDCDCFKACLACANAEAYCNKKAAEMVEP